MNENYGLSTYTIPLSFMTQPQKYVLHSREKTVLHIHDGRCLMR